MILDDATLTTLLQDDGSTVKLSIYLPTHPASSSQAIQEDNIRFKNALQNLQAQELYEQNKAALKKTMTSLHDLVDDVEFWKYRTLGLAIFADTEGYRVLSLDREVSELVCTDTQYHIHPLLLVQSLETAYYVLDINHNRPRLLEGSTSSCVELVIDGMPDSFEAITENVEYDKELQHQSGGVGTFHGHDDTAAVEEYEARYYRAIAAAVDKYLDGRKEPLLLMGVQERISAMRPLLTHSHVLDECVEGSGEAMNEQNVHDNTIAIAESQVMQRQHDRVTEFTQKPPQFTLIGEDDILAAAREGRVDTLLVPSYRYTSDSVRDNVGTSLIVQTNEAQAEIERAVRAVVAQGGRVVAVEMGIFEDDHLRATCRF